MGSAEVAGLDIPEKVKEKFLDEGITQLNPPQVQAVEKGVLEGNDMIVASPTASGKTLIAELAISKQVVENGGKAIYIVPLKALASEKYQDFSERFDDKDVRMSVGDRDESGEYLETADIIVATSEKLDSLLRHNPSWIHEVDLVVTDEIHLLTSPERGPTLEVTLTRLQDILEFQLIGLSATISNSGEMADWLDAELVESDYRPVELSHGILWQDEIEFFDSDKKVESQDNSGFETASDYSEDEAEPVDVQEIESSHGHSTKNVAADTLEKDKQALIFCSSRKGAEKSSDRLAKVNQDYLSREEKQELERISEDILNVLGSPTSQCERLAENVKHGAAFHHAGLVNQQKEIIEDAFREGYIKTISATPTLAAGVNLPAFRVVIRDLKRYTGQGMQFIPVLEYEQITGRAGRPGYDDHGEAISIAKNPGMKNEILERYIWGEAERIQSKLNAEPILRMHTLALIASRYCTNEEELLSFYRQTFFAHQFGDTSQVEQNIKQVLDQLRNYGFVEEEELKPTKTGKRVSELYLDPESAHLMLEQMENAENQETRAISFLFMVSRTTEMAPRLRVKDKEYQDLGQALMDAEPYVLENVPEEWDMEYDMFLEVMKTSLMMQEWISEVDEDALMDRFDVAPGGIRAKVSNADWVLYSAKELAILEDYDVVSEINRLRKRLKYGIDEELLNLVNFDQIGRVRARKLFDAGIRDAEDIREAEFEKLKRLIGDKTARKLKKQVGEENIFDRENIMDYFD